MGCSVDDAEAYELIDAHLDRELLTDEQSDELAAWIKSDPQRADAAFYRIFLHSYLRARLQAGVLPGGTDLAVLQDSMFDSRDDGEASLLVPHLRNSATPHRPRKFSRVAFSVTCSVVLLLAGLGTWFALYSRDPGGAEQLYAYEGFDYPATALPESEPNAVKWPTAGGLQGLNGGTGWSDAWQETNSKVAVIVDYSRQPITLAPKDMRKFGPLGYTDTPGNVLRSTGNQMRTATSPRSITTRRLDVGSFPEPMRDEHGLGRDGSVIWFSFLAQSSLSTADRNRYSYLVIGSKSVAGLRVGKLGAAPSGNWTATGLMNGAEVNLRTSTYPSGEVVLLVTRIIFRPGPEDAVIWINPKLNTEPLEADASMHLPVPDFRFGELSIHANHSTDFDEIRFGGSFRAVAPALPSGQPRRG